MSSISTKADAVAGEELLLEFLRQLEPKKEGGRAAHITLSCLSPLSRRESNLQLATEGLRRLARGGGGQCFRLPNDDLLFFYEAAAGTRVKVELGLLRTQFADDPLMCNVEIAATFTRIYDLAREFSNVVGLVRPQSSGGGDGGDGDAADENSVKHRLRRRERLGRPISPAILPKLDEALGRIDISSFVRRHRICRLLPDTPPEHILTDLSVSLSALSEAVVPGFDLEADRSIARYLAETLDRRILMMLLRHEPQGQHGKVAIPLTLATLLSETFRRFDDQISMMRRGSIVLKVGLTDIFEDLDAARFVFRLARHRGYRTLLSGMTPHNLSLVTLEGLGIEIVRCECTSRLLEDSATGASLAEALRRQAPARMVLAGVDSGAALAAGFRAGIELFQGPYVEQIASDTRRRQRICLVLGHREGA